MNRFCHEKLCKKIDDIVKDYLFNISSLKNHNYFNINTSSDGQRNSYKCTGFNMLMGDNNNTYILEEEFFLEGCTRVFLINPIMKCLFEDHDIDNDWKYGTTFANPNISNREYELGNFVEFTVTFEGTNIGIKYTKSSYSDSERETCNRDYEYLDKGKSIPGFNKINTVEKVYALNWEEISEKSLTKGTPYTLGIIRRTEEVSVEKFFTTFFSKEEYEIFISKTKAAIKQAKDIIALSAIPQLLPNNMFTFKQEIIKKFEEAAIDELEYKFRDNVNGEGLSDKDIKIIKNNFFTNEYYKSLVGSSDFARCFITSEYLYSSLAQGLDIDYTSIVVGYLKSVEQLLYLLYLSAFEGKKGMYYWDRFDNKKEFNISDPLNFRYDPYNIEKDWRQKYFWHKKRIGEEAPEIGRLIYFLRYYDKMWAISEEGKEYIYKCLDDYRETCRNSYFHKDNISAEKYSVVERIRNNTHICLYYILGGFKMMDNSICIDVQLGIEDYSFELLYKNIREKRRRVFAIKYPDSNEKVICYLNADEKVEYNEAGILANAKLNFITTNMTRESVYNDDLINLLENESYVRNNVMTITRDNMPEYIEAIVVNKNRK